MLEEAQTHGAILQQLANIETVLNDTVGWKIHLPLVENAADATTRKIALWLDDNHPLYKIGSGGDEGTGMTIYVGSRDRMAQLANDIHRHFGTDLESTPYALETSDQHIIGRVTARFDCQQFRPDSTIEPKYKNYGDVLNSDAYLLMPWNQGVGNEEKIAQARIRAHLERVNDFSTFYAGSK